MSLGVDTNFPFDTSGHTYHVATKQGDTANRIITVGDCHRARRIATLFDHEPTEIESKRGFLTLTGTYQNVPVSIISIGMGLGVADMLVREVRATTNGPLMIVRFGSCGGVDLNSNPGAIAVASKGAVMISRNFDYWTDQYSAPKGKGVMKPYTMSEVIPADDDLSRKVVKQLALKLGQDKVEEGINATADSFYSTQGRIDPTFGDENEGLIDAIKTKHPEVISLEMESGMLLHLAQVCTYQASKSPKHRGPIRATACAMIFFNRLTNKAIDPHAVDQLELNAGEAILKALTE